MAIAIDLLLDLAGAQVPDKAGLIGYLKASLNYACDAKAVKIWSLDNVDSLPRKVLDHICSHLSSSLISR